MDEWDAYVCVCMPRCACMCVVCVLVMCVVKHSCVTCFDVRSGVVVRIESDMIIMP